MKIFHTYLGWMLVAAAAFAPGAYAKDKDKEDTTVEEPAPLVGQGEPARTLAQRIPSVTHRAFSKRHRIELSPTLGVSLTDPFYRYVMPGVNLNYHILETLSVGIAAQYYAGVQTAVQVTGGAVREQPLFNKPAFDAQAQLTWAPIYGKISWLAEGVLHFDTYATLGGGVISPKSGGMTPGVSLALGQHYFLNEWVGLRLELRNEFYGLSRVTGTPKQLQSLLTASLGICFYLPQEAEPEDL